MTPTVVEVLERHRLLPVIVTGAVGEGARIAEALERGGLPVAEFALRLPGAFDAMASAARSHPEVLVGAGTVIHPTQVDHAVEAGARFLVSPGFSAPMVIRARQLGVPLFPGVATATDLMHAVDLGVDVVKLFPASVVGGVDAITALSGPFPDVRFVPTGGIGPSDLRDYLAVRATLAVGGSWIVDRESVEAGAWSRLEARVTDAVRLAREAGPS